MDNKITFEFIARVSLTLSAKISTNKLDATSALNPGQRYFRRNSMNKIELITIVPNNAPPLGAQDHLNMHNGPRVFLVCSDLSVLLPGHNNTTTVSDSRSTYEEQIIHADCSF